MSRPPETTSSDASALATTTGLWCGSTRMPVARRTRVVRAATRVSATSESRKGVSGGVGTGLSRIGSTTCSPVHTDSKPTSSAARTTRAWTSGSAQLPKLTQQRPKRMQPVLLPLGELRANRYLVSNRRGGEGAVGQAANGGARRRRRRRGQARWRPWARVALEVGALLAAALVVVVAVLGRLATA